MMKKIDIPMLRGSNQFITLSMIISCFPDNSLNWQFFDFYGIGNLNLNISLLEFEEITKNNLHGYCLTWDELKKLSLSIKQVFDCVLLASDSIKPIERNNLRNKNTMDFQICIMAFDSTSWQITGQDAYLSKLEETSFNIS
jgi:hypothetical protein